MYKIKTPLATSLCIEICPHPWTGVCVCVYKLNVVVTYLGWCRWHCKSWKQGSVSESVCVYPRPPLAPLDWCWVRVGEPQRAPRGRTARSRSAVPVWPAKKWWRSCLPLIPVLASDYMRRRKKSNQCCCPIRIFTTLSICVFRSSFLLH